MDTKSYYTHDNGGRPFRVDITEKYVKVYIGEQDEPYVLIKTYVNLSQIFVGRSPKNAMTEFSGGYGPLFDGNSILIGNNIDGVRTYVHIGCNIFSFTPYAKIVEYVSPIGNNDVPYPYAIDELGNYYLMIEDVILLKPVLVDEKDPYWYYYNKTLMTSDLGRHPAIEPEFPFKDIKEFYIDDEDGYQQYTMRYNMHIRENSTYYIVKTSGERIQLTHDMYRDLMAEYAELMGFEPMKTTLIQKRYW